MGCLYTFFLSLWRCTYVKKKKTKIVAFGIATKTKSFWSNSRAKKVPTRTAKKGRQALRCTKPRPYHHRFFLFIYIFGNREFVIYQCIHSTYTYIYIHICIRGCSNALYEIFKWPFFFFGFIVLLLLLLKLLVGHNYGQRAKKEFTIFFFLCIVGFV